MSKAVLLVLVFLLLGAFGFDRSGASAAASLDVQSVLPTDFAPDKYLLVKELNAEGRLAFFYQDHEGYAHYFNGKEDAIINREVMDRYKKLGGKPMDMSYGYDGKHVYFSQPVRWGEKKLLFVKLEPGGKVVYTKELSALGQVIRAASMAFDAGGSVLLTWTDETPPYVKAAYMVVKGDDFPAEERIISDPEGPVLSSRAVYTGKGLAVVYVRTSKEGSGEVRARFLSDGSEKTLDSGRFSDFDLTRGKGGFLLRPYYTSFPSKLIVFDDSFDKLKEHAVDQPKELGSGFSLFSDAALVEAEPFLLGTGSPPNGVEVGEQTTLPQKPNLYYSFGGKGFERIVGGRPFMFTSMAPSVESSATHTVVAYLDRRFASPTVMVAVFDRKGELVKRDVLIEKPGLRTGSPKVGHLSGDSFRIFYPVEDGLRKTWRYRAKDVRADKLTNLYDPPRAKTKKSLLMAAAQKFAKCRKKNDYGCVYDMFDPDFRSGQSKAYHEDRMTTADVAILDFKYEDCEILDDSVLALCNGHVKAKLPKDFLQRPIKEAERDVEHKLTADLWLFISGKWYYAVGLPMLGYAAQW